MIILCVLGRSYDCLGYHGSSCLLWCVCFLQAAVTVKGVGSSVCCVNMKVGTRLLRESWPGCCSTVVLYLGKYSNKSHNHILVIGIYYVDLTK